MPINGEMDSILTHLGRLLDVRLGYTFTLASEKLKIAGVLKVIDNKAIHY